MANHKEKAIDYFERHKASNECHITSDDRVFHTKGNALSFATTLDNQKVNSFTRKGVETKTKDTLESGESDLIEKLKELEALELVTTNYQAMKEMVKYFKIETENNKAETLITALTEYKLKNQE